MTADYPERLRAARKVVRRLGQLYITSAKLTLAERLSIFLTAATVLLLCIILGMFALMFLAIALARVLSEALSPAWAYTIIGGIFLVLISLIFMLKTSLIENPIARFVSKLILARENQLERDAADDHR